MKKIKVTWDIPEEGNSDNWVVQFWMIEDGKKAVLIKTVDKNSDNFGSLTFNFDNNK